MGRIFEVRKHTMFARWDRMAKQFSRISKEIIVAVKAGGPDPHSNPALHRAAGWANHFGHKEIEALLLDAAKKSGD